MPSDGVQLTLPNRGKPSLSGGVVLGLALLLVLLCVFRVYYIGGYGTCDLLWNEREGYLFVHGERSGYNSSYLGYFFEVVRSYFGVVAPPDERRRFTVVARITPPLGLERYEESEQFEYFTPIDGGLYAGRYNDATPWKWAGTHFEKASATAQDELGNVDRLVKTDFSFVNGWSGLYSIESKRQRFQIQVGELPVAVTLKDGQVSIALVHPDNESEKRTVTERLYFGKGQPQRVSKSEYERVFGANAANSGR